MKEGEVSEPIRTPQGYAFITVTGKQDPYVPKLDEVKAKVRDDVLKQKAIEAARGKAAAIDAALKSGDFEKAAKAAGLEVEDDRAHRARRADGRRRRQPGARSGGVRAAAGGVSDPVVTDNGAAIVKVLERKDVAPDESRSRRTRSAASCSTSASNKFFAAYMTKARQRMKININRDTIAQIVG